MPARDKRVDDYISRAQPFARPILLHLRNAVHQACPETEETIKWGHPHFTYKDKILCSMASFKEHCAFGFFLGSVMKDPHGLMKRVGTSSGMGHFGRIRQLGDLPPDKILSQYVKEAMSLTDKGVLKVKPKSTQREELEVPEYFMTVLRKDKAAWNNFQELSYSHRKEYIEWIVEAKMEATRDRRLATAVQWLKEGKNRNWKYTKS